MPRPRTTSIIPVRLPIPVVQAVKARAEREGQSVNRFVGDIITEALDGESQAGQEPARMMNTKRAGAMNTGPKSRKGERL